MKDEEKEKKLISLLAARRSDLFWARQRAQITVAATEKRWFPRAWMLAPAAAMAALIIFVPGRSPRPVQIQEQQIINTAFIERLELLEDMDVLEVVPEEEL